MDNYLIQYFGQFKLNKSLSIKHSLFLRDFSKTRHYQRVWDDYENNGKWFLDPDGKLAPKWTDPIVSKIFFTKSKNEFDKISKHFLEKYGCINYNEPTIGMPSLYCHWVPTDDNTGICWNGQEKFYDGHRWLKYIVDEFLKPWGYVLNGKIKIRFDSIRLNKFLIEWLVVKNNEITLISETS